MSTELLNDVKCRLMSLPQRPVSFDRDTPQELQEVLDSLRLRSGSASETSRRKAIAETIYGDIENLAEATNVKIDRLCAIIQPSSLIISSDIQIESRNDANEFKKQLDAYLHSLGFDDVANSPLGLLNHCRSLESSSGVRTALKTLHLLVDSKIKAKDHKFFDELLARTDPFKDSSSLTLGILTVTAPMRASLAFFKGLVEKFELSLTKSGRDPSRLVARFKLLDS